MQGWASLSQHRLNDECKSFSGLPSPFFPGECRMPTALFWFQGSKNFKALWCFLCGVLSPILPVSEPSITGFLIFNSYYGHCPPGFLGLTSIQCSFDCFPFILSSPHLNPVHQKTACSFQLPSHSLNRRKKDLKKGIVFCHAVYVDSIKKHHIFILKSHFDFYN